MLTNSMKVRFPVQERVQVASRTERHLLGGLGVYLGEVDMRLLSATLLIYLLVARANPRLKRTW